MTEPDRWPDKKAAGRGKRGPEKLSDVLSELLSKRRYAQPMTQKAHDGAWQRALDVVGVRGPAAEKSRVTYFRDGTLTIEVASAALRYELHAFWSNELLAALQADDAISSIRKLVFRVGPGSASPRDSA